MVRVSSLKRRGRPSVQEGERTESVQVRLPKSMHDAVCRAAIDRGVSVSKIVRDALRRPTSTTATS
jgi:hypothetical protein